MAVTLQQTLANQSGSATNSYCYLYEPYRMIIGETDSDATKIYIKLVLTDLSDTSTTVAEEEAYGEYDLNTAKVLTVDLMRLAQQYHNADVYKLEGITSLQRPDRGWDMILSKYRYEFQITSDVSTAPISLVLTPVIGGRSFQFAHQSVYGADLNVTPSPLTEFELHQVDVSQRWGGFPIPEITLKSVLEVDMRPTVQFSYLPTVTYDGSPTFPAPCGGMLYWKSRYGGWMYWGMDLKKKTQAKKYTGNIPVGLYESISNVTYIEADYTGIELSYKITLKALSLTSDELEAVQGIMASPAVYYQEDINARLELMRLTSASAPIDNKTNGGDFSVSLASISKSSQMTR